MNEGTEDDAPPADAQGERTIDPDYKGPIYPGRTPDQTEEEYQAAIDRGDIKPISQAAIEGGIPLDRILGDLEARATAAEDVARAAQLENQALRDELLTARAAVAEQVASNTQLDIESMQGQLQATAKAHAQERESLRAQLAAALEEANEARLQAKRQAQVVRGKAPADAPRPAAAPRPSLARRQEVFDEEIDRQQDRHENLLKGLLGTLGMPRVWSRVLKAAAPAVGVAARGFVRALHPESPGGSKPTRDEIDAIVDRAATRFRRELVEEFTG